MSKTSRCLVCCDDRTTKGMLRGVCERCQVDVFVSAHMDKIELMCSVRFDAKRQRLDEREKDIETNELGIKLIELLREI